MAEFSYVARDNSGQRVTGTIGAASRREALAAISARSLFPVEVTGAAAQLNAKKIRRVSSQMLAIMFGQLADLLRSGVPLLRGLDVLRQQSTKPAMKEVLGEIHHHVEEGASMAEAMGRFPNVFGEMAVSMVRAGSEGGFLEEALARVAEFTEAQDDLKKRTIGAMAYPMFLACVGVIVVSGLMIFFVPQFNNLFDNLRQRGELPMMTEWVLGTSSFMKRFGIWALIGLAFGAYFLRKWAVTDVGRLYVDRIKIKMPLVGGVFLSLAVARFCRVLGTLLHNGVPIIRSLEISSDGTGNRVLAGAIRSATDDISAGQRLAGPLRASGHFPPTVVEMISVAEESNTLETVLLRVSESLERRTFRQLDLAVRLLEPVMLLILAAVVLVLVIGLLLPVIKMSTTV
jgi:type II secretory pathway component PulF